MNIFVLIIATVGLILNIKHKWQCFLFWMVSNTYWSLYNAVRGENVQSVIFGIFFVSSVYGAFKWSWEEKTEPEEIVQLKVSPLEFQKLCYEGNVGDAETIEKLKERLQAVVTLMEPFCRRTIAIKDIKPWGKVKVNWLFTGAQRILDELNGKKEAKEKTKG